MPAVLPISIRFDVAPATTFTVPDGSFVRVRHDFQTATWMYEPRCFRVEGWKPDRNPDGAFPDTFPLVSVNGIQDPLELSERWQWTWHSLLNRACSYRIPPYEMLNRWATITEHGRALTDSFAVQQGYADYVLGLNLTGKPIRQKKLVMGGNICRVIGTDRDHYIIEALNVTQDPPSVDQLWGKWWLVQWATQTNQYKEVHDWPWLNWDNIPYGVPYMLISDDGKLKIPKAWCDPIPSGSLYSPYA